VYGVVADERGAVDAEQTALLRQSIAARNGNGRPA
jgi:hypothetical protein